MKILYVVTKSNYGGAQRYVLDLATSFHARGHEVVVAFGGTGTRGAEIGRLAALLTERGIRTLFIRHLVRDVLVISDILAFFELIRMLFREKPNVLHLNSSKAGALGAPAGRICGIQKILFTSHGLAFDESWRPLWQRILIKYITWLTIFLSHKTIMISKKTAETARNLGFVRNKVVLIYNGVQELEFEDQISAREYLMQRTRSVARSESFWIGTITELHPNKNLGSALKALSGLVASNLNVLLVIIGDGEAKDELTRLAEKLGIRENVHFVGFVPNASKYVTAFDAFILPSKKEGLPYVLLEAGLAGIPAIASDISGNNDIIEDKRNGLLISVNSAKDLERAIRIYLKEPLRAKSYGSKLQRRIMEQFSIEKMFRETEQLYY